MKRSTPQGSAESVLRTGVIRLAIGQCHPIPRDLAGSLQRAERLLIEAAQGGADWLVLPELFLGGYQLEDLGSLALEASSPQLEALRQVAKRTGVGFQVGFVEAHLGTYWNSVLVVSPEGDAQTYAKTHLYGREVGTFSGGHRFISVMSAAVGVGSLICYDIEFPEPARILAGRGVSLVLVSSANMVPFAEDQVLFARARARENQIFMAVANRVGVESGYQFCGTSVVSDPLGTILCRAGERSEQTLLVDCDMTLVANSRTKHSYLQERRPDLYCELVDQ